MSDLRLDLLPRVRKMAVNFAGGSHPWEDMSEQELLISAGLYGTDMSTGEKGFNLAAIMLLGKDDLEPNPKNPIIASFFRNIGRADKLGSGVRNLFKYSKYYSGKEPEFIEGDIFRIIVPLDEAYSFDIGVDKVDLVDQTEKKADQTEKKADQTSRTELTERESQLLEVIKNYPEMTNEDISQELKWSVSKVKYYMKKLKKIGIIKRNGSSRKGFWDIFE